MKPANFLWVWSVSVHRWNLVRPLIAGESRRALARSGVFRVGARRPRQPPKRARR
jgi:hypothetical protein